jgi:hypothetical protein
MKEAVKSRFNLGEGELPDLLMLNGGVATQGSGGDGEYFSKVSVVPCGYNGPGVADILLT